FIRHRKDIDGYAGDTTATGELKSGWGYEASGYLALPGDLDKKYKSDLERAAASTLPGQQSSTFVAGEAGGFRGRVGESRKNLAPEKAPAPATAAPMGKVEESDREAFAAEKSSLADSLGGELERKEDKRPEALPDAPPVVDDRKIIRNADLHLEVDKYDDAYKAIGEITRAKKGFIAGASTTKLANGKIRATVTLRIPPEQFEETLAELGKLGVVRHQGISTSDVTKQYQDLASRLKSKETLVERLKKVLLEGKGTVKELMEVEVQMGATIEQIESIKGELKYYDNLVGMSTITMQVFEKDMGLPFEYVQTLQSVITVRAFDADAKYAEAQKIILDAGGQVVQSQMARSNEESASGFVKGKVDAEKFPDVRGKLKALGQYVDQDTVNQQQTGRGGQGDAKPGAPVKKEQAVIDFTVNTPPVVVTRQAAVAIEASPAGTAYHSARQEVQAAGGEIVAGSLMDRTGGATAFVKAQIDEEKFAALVEKLKTLGKVKNATVKQDEPGSDSGRAPLLRKKGEIVFEITTPPPLIPEESGLGRVLRDTFTGSIAGLLWSVEKLFVGLALAGPWIVLAILVLLVWKKTRRPKPA
ncbi:MAG TPA: DUF4349 domain-containing protein, partial [Planctomycetota bacterium]|nr:DUF4349 domain-containing protein [Planctomycetota bacterium]